jgi:hypothetical protein
VVAQRGVVDADATEAGREHHVDDRGRRLVVDRGVARVLVRFAQLERRVEAAVGKRGELEHRRREVVHRADAQHQLAARLHVESVCARRAHVGRAVVVAEDEAGRLPV